MEGYKSILLSANFIFEGIEWDILTSKIEQALLLGIESSEKDFLVARKRLVELTKGTALFFL